MIIWPDIYIYIICFPVLDHQQKGISTEIPLSLVCLFSDLYIPKILQWPFFCEILAPHGLVFLLIFLSPPKPNVDTPELATRWYRFSGLEDRRIFHGFTMQESKRLLS